MKKLLLISLIIAIMLCLCSCVNSHTSKITDRFESYDNTVSLPDREEIAELIQVDSSLIDDIDTWAYGIIDNKSAVVIPISVYSFDQGAYHDSYIVIATESDVTYYEIGGSYLRDDVYLRDFDGDGSDEILVHQLIAVAGGAGGYQSYVLKVEDNEIRKIFENPGSNYFDTGFSSSFKDGYQVEISNSITGYKAVLDFSNTKTYEDWFFNADGTVMEERIDENWILVDSFREFIPEDIDNDGVFEISCLQYTSLLDHSDYIGDCKSILKYDKNTGEFKVSDASFIPSEKLLR